MGGGVALNNTSVRLFVCQSVHWLSKEVILYGHSWCLAFVQKLVYTRNEEFFGGWERGFLLYPPAPQLYSSLLCYLIFETYEYLHQPADLLTRPSYLITKPSDFVTCLQGSL